MAPVAVQDPRLATRAKDLEGFPALERIGGEHGLPHGPVHLAFPRQPRGVLQRLGRVGEPLLHLARAQKGALRLRQVPARHAVEGGVPRDGPKRVMQPVVRPVDEVHVVRRHARHLLLAGPVEERTVSASRDQLGIDRKGVAKRREERALLAQEHERGRVLADGALQGERGIEVPGREDVAEGAVALTPAREQHRARGPLAVRRATARGSRLHDLRARDRLEAPLVADLTIEDEPIERVRVGQREAVHAALARGVGQSFEPLRSPHEGVVAMDVQVRER